MAPNFQRGSELERLIPKHLKHIPRKCASVQCGSEDVLMRYFNNHNLNQPRFVCNTCKMYFTLGGKSRQPYKTKKRDIVMKRSNIGISKIQAGYVETTGSKSIRGAMCSNHKTQMRRQPKQHANRRVRSPTLEVDLGKSNSMDVENEEKVSKDVAIHEEINLVEDDEGNFEDNKVDGHGEEDEDYFPDDEVEELLRDDDDCYVPKDGIDEVLKDDNDHYVVEDEVDEPSEDDDGYVLEDEFNKPIEEDYDRYVLEDDVDKAVEVEDGDGYVLEDEVHEPIEVEDDDRYILKDEVDEPVEVEDDNGYVLEDEVDEPVEADDDDGYVQKDEADELVEFHDDDRYVPEDEVYVPIEVDEELEINNLANVSEVKIQKQVLHKKATKKSSLKISSKKETNSKNDTLPKRKQIMKKATRYLIYALTTLEEVYLEKHAMMLDCKVDQVEQAREQENRERSKYEETLHSFRNCSMRIVGAWIQYKTLTTTRLKKMIARENELKIVSQEVEELYYQVKQIDINYICHSEVVKIETKANQLWNRVVELVE